MTERDLPDHNPKVAGSNPPPLPGVEDQDLDDEVFEEKLAAAHAELRALASEAGEWKPGWTPCWAKLLPG